MAGKDFPVAPGGAAAVEAGLDLLFEEVLTADTTMVTFDNIPQTYNDLIIVITARTTMANTHGYGGDVIMEQNAVTSAGSYRNAALRFGSLTGGATQTSTAIGKATSGPSSAAGSYGAITCRLINYASTDQHKAWQSYVTTYRGASGSQFIVNFVSGQKTDNTDAITRLDWSVYFSSRQDADFVSGCTFRVYGVR